MINDKPNMKKYR